jgi:hypothetical protein
MMQTGTPNDDHTKRQTEMDMRSLIVDDSDADIPIIMVTSVDDIDSLANAGISAITQNQVAPAFPAVS